MAISFQTLAEQGKIHSVCVSNYENENNSDTEPKSSSAPGTPSRSHSAGSKSLVSAKNRRLMVPEKPNYSLNLWSIMKNCIGKELTKIPMPVKRNLLSIKYTSGK